MIAFTIHTFFWSLIAAGLLYHFRNCDFACGVVDVWRSARAGQPVGTNPHPAPDWPRNVVTSYDVGSFVGQLWFAEVLVVVLIWLYKVLALAL